MTGWLGGIVYLIGFSLLLFSRQKSYGGYLVLTPFFVFVGLELLILWPAAIYSYAVGISPYGYPMVVTGLGFISFLLGFLLVSRLLLPRRQEHLHYYQNLPVDTSLPEHHYLWGILFAAIILVLMGIFMYRGIPPVFKHLMGWVPEEPVGYVSQSRLQLTKGHLFGQGYRGQGLIRSFMSVGWPFLIGLSLALYRSKKRGQYIVIAALNSLFAVIFIAGDGTRAPILFAIVSIFMVFSLLWRARIRHIVLLGLIGTILFVGLSLSNGKIAIHEGDSPFSMVAHALFFDRNSLVKRVFSSASNGINTVHVIELIEDGSLDYRLGAVHLQKAILALPGAWGGLPFSHELSRLLNKKSSSSFSTTTYLATLYIDLGLPGVMMGYLLIGVFIAMAEYVLYRSPKEPLRVTIAGLVGFFLGLMSLNGVVSFLSSLVVIFLVASFFAIGTSLRSMLVLVTGTDHHAHSTHE